MRVLFLVHDYPPVGGGGVQRVLHLVRSLSAAGHQVHLLALDKDPGRLRDDSLLSRHPPSVPITRYQLPSLSPVIDGFRRLRLSRVPTLLLPSDLYTEATVFARWTARAALEVAKQFHPDVVIASAPPHGVCDAAQRVAAATGAALVLDLRDPWVEPLIGRLPSELAYRWARSVQRRCLAAASLVVVTAPTMEHQLAQLTVSRPRRVVTITNGFDESAPISAAAQEKAREICSRPGIKTAAFVGRLFRSDTTGGSRRGPWADRVFDRLAVGQEVIRGEDYHAGPWFQALELLAAKRPDLAGHLRTVFVGDIPQQGGSSERTRAMFPVESYGYQPFAVAAAVMRAADALLLFNPSTTDDSPSFIIPGKLFEYLAAGPPILAMCGPGDCADIVTGTGTGVWVHDKDPTRMSAHVERWLTEGTLGNVRNEPEIARYSRGELGRRFVAEVERAGGETRTAVA